MFLKNSITKLFRSLLRIPHDFINRIRLVNKDCTILCNNCTGGIIYHSLKLPFLSPTINLYMSAPDFVKFCSNLNFYLQADMTYYPCDKKFPVGKLHDILLYFVHANSFQEANAAWNRRKTRIKWDSTYLIMTQRDGCKQETIEAFEKLPYIHKVIFVNKPMPQYSSAFYLPGTGGEEEVLPLTNYKSVFSGLRWIDDFDYVEFLNSGRLQVRRKK